MKIHNDITKVIGHTPLVRLTRIIDAGTNTVAAKLEQFNPGASVKDRAALSMIEDAEMTGKLKEGGTIIEATSGNTGIALAFIAAARGYKTIIVMPESMSLERQRLLAAFGAKLELTPAHLGMKGSIDRAQALAKEIQGSFLVGQFDNPANPRIHERTTAEEILEDTDGKVDVFIAGVGTGGTITGVGRRLKKHNHKIKIIAVEPAASSVLSGGRCGPHMIQGIGPGFVPSVFEKNIIDEIITVGDQEAYEWTRKIIYQEGILAGISSGAAACGVEKYIRKNKPAGQLIVTVFPDTAERYLSVPMLFKE